METKQFTSEQPGGWRRNQKGNIYIYPNKSKWKYRLPKSMGCCKSYCEREVYSNKCIYSENRYQINYLN